MFQCRAEVVVAGVVVAKALFWIDIVTVFGLFVTDFAQSDYDHFSYDHLCIVPNVGGFRPPDMTFYLYLMPPSIGASAYAPEITK